MTKGPEYWHSRRLSMTLWSFLLISSVVVEVQLGRTRLGPGHFDSGEKKKEKNLTHASGLWSGCAAGPPGTETGPHTRSEPGPDPGPARTHSSSLSGEKPAAAAASSSLSSCAFSSFPLCSPRSLQGPGQSGFIHRRKRRRMRRSGEEDGEGRTRAELGESFVAGEVLVQLCKILPGKLKFLRVPCSNMRLLLWIHESPMMIDILLVYLLIVLHESIKYFSFISCESLTLIT